MIFVAKRARLRKAEYSRKFKLAFAYVGVRPKRDKHRWPWCPRSFINAWLVFSRIVFQRYENLILSIRQYGITLLTKFQFSLSIQRIPMRLIMMFISNTNRIPALGRTHRCSETECSQVVCATCPNTSSWPALPIFAIESVNPGPRYVGAGLSKLTYVVYDNPGRFHAAK